jgi:hypothetical protein
MAAAGVATAAVGATSVGLEVVLEREAVVDILVEAALWA